MSKTGLRQRGICKHSGEGWLPGNQCSSCSWQQPTSTRLHTQKELHLNIYLSLVDSGVKRRFAPLSTLPTSHQCSNKRGKDGTRQWGRKLINNAGCKASPWCSMSHCQGQEQRLSLHLSRSGQSDTSSSAKAVRVSASSARPRAQPPVEGRRKEGSSL